MPARAASHRQSRSLSAARLPATDDEMMVALARDARAAELRKEILAAGGELGPAWSDRIGDLIIARERAAAEKARAEALEEAARSVADMPQCPFERPNELAPEDPCPVCGGLGTDNALDLCRSPTVAIRALAKSKTQP